MSRTWLCIAMFIAPAAWAAGPTVTSVSGASNYVLTGTPTIYGGAAGQSCSDPDTGKMCDGCAATAAFGCGANTPLCACNKTRIWDGAIVRINLKKPDGVSGNARVRQQDTNAGNMTVVTANNQGNFVDLNWTEICNKIGSSCDAATGGTYTVHVWIDKNADDAISSGEETTDVTFKVVAPPANSYDVYGSPTAEGIDTFTPYPGDEKVFLESLHASSGFPTLGYGGKIGAIRAYAAKTSLNEALPGAEVEKDITVVDDGNNLGKNIVDGLDNEQLYFFRIALIDEAKNVVQFFPAPSTDPNCTSSPNSNCPYAARPSQVLGLLTKDLNCFIASAAYGSALEPKLGVLRAFRSRFLLPNRWGRLFIERYYEFGPYAARYIADKPALRSFVRALLWPVYAFSYVALKLGFSVACGAALLALSAPLGAAFLARRKWLRRA